MTIGRNVNSAEDDQVWRDEHPADARHAERALQRAHRHLDAVQDSADERPHACAQCLEHTSQPRLAPIAIGEATVTLLRRCLHLLLDVSADALQRIVEAHLAGDRLAKTRAVGLKSARLYW